MAARQPRRGGSVLAMQDADGGAQGQRLDRWLWFARVTKTRTLATELVQSGRVRVNREKVSKPSATLKVGDVVTVTIRGVVRILKVAAHGARRGPAKEARELYEDLTPPKDPRAGAGQTPSAAGDDNDGATSAQTAAAEPVAATGPVGQRIPGSGRPTKRDRRSLDRLRDTNG